jgi:acetyl esterase/lipase
MGYLSEPKDGWFIPVFFDPADDEKIGVEKEMRQVLEKLGPGLDKPEITAATLRGEWQGGEGKMGDDLKTKETFTRLSEATKEGPVILMLHGGGHITGSPAMERSATFKLARMCHGRVFAVDFRLAPQHPFPAALLDAIVAYKYLIEPPPGALHTAVHPTKLVIAGDSSGVYCLPRGC